MKPIKKIAIAALSLLMTGAASTVLALGCNAFWAIPTTIGIPFFGVLILFGFTIWDKVVETQIISKYLALLEAKPYRPYQIDLNCNYCGKNSPVDVILTDTTFKCPHCTRTNGVHVSFMTTSLN